MAISDPLGITAQGLETLVRESREKDLEALERIVDSRHVGKIVVGLPKRMDGTLGTQAQRVERFVGDLRQRFRVPVETWDERLTTVAAERALREGTRRRARKKGLVDRLAAVFILQGYLDRVASRGDPGEPE